jgi:malate synthase
MNPRVTVGDLRIAQELYDLVENEITPGLNIDSKSFWNSFDAIVSDLAANNRKLLDKRDDLQVKLDDFHRRNKGQDINPDSYLEMLREIGYLNDNSPTTRITTENVDPEIASIAGPQLVVPVDNARYALNAANARWGSLYNALYGTDVLSEDDGAQRGGEYNPIRGQQVTARAAEFLDQAVD